VCVDEHEYLAGIEKLINRKFKREIIEGFEPDPTIKAEPIQQRRNSKPQGQPKRRENAPREYVEKRRDKKR
jgi:ATP-dependent RNA helicase RhlE